MDVEALRKILENTLAPNIKESSVAFEILFKPSFSSQGQTIFCQIRRREKEMFICYEHFSRYDFYALSYTNVSSSFDENIFTDSFCGIVIVDKISQIEIEELICKISAFKSVETALGLDGYNHTVIINNYKYSWWCEPDSENSIVCDKLVSKIPSLLPQNFRNIHEKYDEAET